MEVGATSLFTYRRGRRGPVRLQTLRRGRDEGDRGTLVLVVVLVLDAIFREQGRCGSSMTSSCCPQLGHLVALFGGRLRRRLRMTRRAKHQSSTVVVAVVVFRSPSLNPANGRGCPFSRALVNEASAWIWDRRLGERAASPVDAALRMQTLRLKRTAQPALSYTLSYTLSTKLATKLATKLWDELGGKGAAAPQVSHSIQLAAAGRQRPHWSETPHAVCLRISLKSSHLRSFCARLTLSGPIRPALPLAPDSKRPHK
jgi:hypothetical protein